MCNVVFCLCEEEMLRNLVSHCPPKCHIVWRFGSSPAPLWSWNSPPLGWWALLYSAQSILFTRLLKIAENSLAFLDIKLPINDNGLSTSVHYKSTDSHNYLLHSSSHPQHVQNAIPFSQFLRLRRLCSDDTDFNNKCEEMCQFYKKRGYPDSAVTTGKHHSKEIDRETALQTSQNEETDRIPFTLAYRPQNLVIKNVILKNFKILRNDPETKHIFSITTTHFIQTRQKLMHYSHLKHPHFFTPIRVLAGDCGDFHLIYTSFWFAVGGEFTWRHGLRIPYRVICWPPKNLFISWLPAMFFNQRVTLGNNKLFYKGSTMCWKEGVGECTTHFCPREPGTSLTFTCIKSGGRCAGVSNDWCIS